ncbi:hypothetical protein [Erythrobacter insulae]|nr:hypothetical protein [Erythrobacter insulae]
MPVTWSDIAFRPGENLSKEIAQAWSWLLKNRDFRPFIASKFGDVFYETSSGTVECLSCSLGDIEEVAESRAVFEQTCDEVGEDVMVWFGPGLIEELHSAGKVAGADECYAFAILPIFAQCEYSAANLNAVPAREVLVGLAQVHSEIADLPDGTSVQIKITE